MNILEFTKSQYYFFRYFEKKFFQYNRFFGYITIVTKRADTHPPIFNRKSISRIFYFLGRKKQGDRYEDWCRNTRSLLWHTLWQIPRNIWLFKTCLERWWRPANKTRGKLWLPINGKIY